MATWAQLGAQLFWVAVAQLALSLLSAALSPLFQWLTENSDLWMDFKLKWSCTRLMMQFPSVLTSAVLRDEPS